MLRKAAFLFTVFFLILLITTPCIADAEPLELSLDTDRARVGTTLTASGTAEPESWLVIKVLDEDAYIVFFETVQTDRDGNYSLSFKVPSAAVRTSLTIVAGSGEETVQKQLYIRTRSNILEQPKDEKTPEEEPEEEPEEDTSQIKIKLTIGQKTAKVNDQVITLDTMPLIEADAWRTIVPIRFIGESLGAEVEWLPSTRRILIRDAGNVLIIQVGSYNSVINGKLVKLDCPPRIMMDGRTFVPLRFISENLNSKVDWNETTREISITR